MPALSRWAVRASLLHLTAGFTLGALLLINKGIGLHPGLGALLPTHVELLLLGWMAQLALGVAFWILPRFGGRRGNLALAWAAIGLLNAGVLLAGLGPALGAAGLTVAAGRALTLGAGVAFALHAWPRVKPPGGGR